MCGCWGRGSSGGGGCTCSITGGLGIEVTDGGGGAFTVAVKPPDLISGDIPNALVVGDDGKLKVPPASVSCAMVVACVVDAGPDLFGCGIEIAAGKITVKADPGGGIECTGGALALKVDPVEGNALSVTADGVKVISPAPSCATIVQCLFDTPALFGCGFTLDSTAKTITVKTDPAGGIECTPDGLALKLDPAPGNLLALTTAGVALTCESITGSCATAIANAIVDPTDETVPRIGVDPGTGKLTIISEVPRPLIDNLRTAPLSIGGTNGGALLHAAPASPEALTYASGSELVMIHGDVIATSDNTAVWVPWRGPFFDPWFSTGSTEPIPRDEFTEAQWRAWLSRCGDQTTPKAGQDETKPDGGWWGYRHRQPSGMLLRDVYDTSSRNIVVIPEVDDQLALDALLKCLREEARYATDYTIIACQTLPLAVEAVAAGLTEVAVRVEAGQETTETAAAIRATGAKWVVADYTISDAALQSYDTGGLSCIVYGATRHTHRVRLDAIGMKRYLSHDPVYTRGYPYTYRQVVDRWTDKRPMSGELTRLTDDGYHCHSQQPGSMPWDVRGFFDWSPGKCLPPGFVVPTSEMADGSPGPFGAGVGTMLAGWVGPLIDPQNYTLTTSFTFDANGSIGDLVGLAFGVPDDGPSIVKSGNHALFNPKTAQFIVSAYKTDGTATTAQAVIGQPVGLDEKVTMRVVVTPAVITLYRLNNAGDVIGGPMTLANGDTRGDYVHLVMQGQGNTMSIRWRSLTVEYPATTPAGTGDAEPPAVPVRLPNDIRPPGVPLPAP